MTTLDEATQAALQLQAMAVRYHAYAEDPQFFLNDLPKLGDDRLRQYLGDIKGRGLKVKDGIEQIRPVTFLRRVVIERLLGGQKVTLQDLDELQERITARDVEYFADFPDQLEALSALSVGKRGPFASWTHFSLLFYVDYWWHVSEVQGLLGTVADAVETELDVSGLDRHLAGFNYNQSFGTDFCWLALYPEEVGSHTQACQLFLAFRHDGIRFGLYSGSEIEPAYRDEETVAPESFDMGDAVAAFRSRLPKFYELNRKPPVKSSIHPLNLILYGPPGTGKTYSVQRRAVEIIDGSVAGLDDEAIRLKFRAYAETGRVEFVTFHPSYSYEEFVEGFRYDEDKRIPVLQEGTFLRLAGAAVNPRYEVRSTDETQIWKVSLGDASEQHVYERSMANDEIAIGWHKDVDLSEYGREEIEKLFVERHASGETNNIRSVDYFVNEVQEGDYVVVLKDMRTIRGIGVVSGPYRYRGDDYDEYPHTRPVEWLDRAEHDIYEINGKKRIGMPTIYRLNNMQLQDLVELLPESTRQRERFVLVIDEINRGNIARVFGELITILEADKRKGAPNEMAVRLPYSKTLFTVPGNLYVIGTMNTADRSIALLDVALRRRFEFEELMPDVEVVRNALSLTLEEETDGGSVELTAEHVELICAVFVALNRRITVLLDRDHQIGHSEFMKVQSLNDLHSVLYRRVFPLLQEYFYNDRDRLVAVCGEYAAATGTGFVTSLAGEYGSIMAGLELDTDTAPWEFHRYKVGELVSALQGTFAEI